MHHPFRRSCFAPLTLSSLRPPEEHPRAPSLSAPAPSRPRLSCPLSRLCLRFFDADPPSAFHHPSLSPPVREPTSRLLFTNPCFVTFGNPVILHVLALSLPAAPVHALYTPSFEPACSPINTLTYLTLPPSHIAFPTQIPPPDHVPPPACNPPPSTQPHPLMSTTYPQYTRYTPPPTDTTLRHVCIPHKSLTVTTSHLPSHTQRPCPPPSHEPLHRPALTTSRPNHRALLYHLSPPPRRAPRPSRVSCQLSNLPPSRITSTPS